MYPGVGQINSEELISILVEELLGIYEAVYPYSDKLGINMHRDIINIVMININKKLKELIELKFIKPPKNEN